MGGVSNILFRSDPELLLCKSSAPVRHIYCFIDGDISECRKVVI